MQAPHHRKVELQSNADLSFLYTNALALSRQKLDQVYPPSANDNANEPDPVKTRVKELVEEFIHQTYTLAADSISINGVDLNSRNLPFGSSLSAPETIEYEAYDGALASRVSSLYAQLESLTTSVAQLRREAPGKAAKMYADTLNRVLDEEDAEFDSLIKSEKEQDEKEKSVVDVIKPEWKLDIPFGSDAERERWQNGEMAEIYTDTLQTLLRLQGEYVEGDEQGSMEASRNALSTTIGKAERAGRAVEVVRKM